MTEKLCVKNSLSETREVLKLTLDDREEELGFTKPPNTEHIDRDDKHANSGKIDWSVLGITIPESENNLRRGDFVGNCDGVRLGQNASINLSDKMAELL